MIIEITQKPDDGKFIVGDRYEVVSKYQHFVYALDDIGNMEPVYNYEFKVVQQ